jgi:hypothetical protein
MDCQSADGSNLIKLWEKGLRAVKNFGVRKGEPPRSKAPSPNELGEGAVDKGTSVEYKKSAAWGKFHPL